MLQMKSRSKSNSVLSPFFVQIGICISSESYEHVLSPRIL